MDAGPPSDGLDERLGPETGDDDERTDGFYKKLGIKAGLAIHTLRRDVGQEVEVKDSEATDEGACRLWERRFFCGTCHHAELVKRLCLLTDADWSSMGRGEVRAVPTITTHRDEQKEELDFGDKS